jgi:hypothetical protein
MAEPIADEERIAWLRLARSGGVGPRTFRQLDTSKNLGESDVI